MRTFDLDQLWPTRFPALTAAVVHAPRDNNANSDDKPDTPRCVLPEVAIEDLALYEPSVTFGGWRSHGQTALHRTQAFLLAFDARAAAWLALGFMTGMVAWHAVGFWGFVSETVLYGGGRSAPTAWEASGQHGWTAPARVTTGSLAAFTPAPGACLALILDRETATMSATYCASDSQPMRDAGRRRRGDRLTGMQARLEDRNSWTASTVQADLRAPEQISESEFDLTLPLAE